jgi:hypothetical protein
MNYSDPASPGCCYPDHVDGEDFGGTWIISTYYALVRRYVAETRRVVPLSSFIVLLHLQTFIGILYRNLAFASCRRGRRPSVLKRNLTARGAAAAAGPSSISYRPARSAPWTRAAAAAASSTAPPFAARLPYHVRRRGRSMDLGRGPHLLHHRR